MKNIEDMIPCPRCEGGNKPLVNFPAFPSKKMLELSDKELLRIFACRICKGKGFVSEKVPKWIENGLILKNRRIDKKLTLRKATKTLNILPHKLSDMECGIIEPDMSISYEDIEG